MKKVLFILSAVAILASCTPATTTEEVKEAGDSTATTTVTVPSVDTTKVDTTAKK